MLFPKLVPQGMSYVKIPSSKRAAMRVLLETVQRGSHYFTTGTVEVAKALGFADKMARLYRADVTQAQRAYAKANGKANTSLTVFPESCLTLRWWLLVTPGQGVVHEREQLMDAHDKHTHLSWGDQYELAHKQHPQSQGGGRHWTWRLREPHRAELETAIRLLAAAHGSPQPRQDDLGRLVEALLRMPGFHGIREQLKELFKVGAETWQRTHAASESFPWPEKLPYLDKAFACYHVPEPLRLDVLVHALLHQCDIQF